MSCRCSSRTGTRESSPLLYLKTISRFICDFLLEQFHAHPLPLTIILASEERAESHLTSSSAVFTVPTPHNWLSHCSAELPDQLTGSEIGALFCVSWMFGPAMSPSRLSTQFGPLLRNPALAPIRWRGSRYPTITALSRELHLHEAFQRGKVIYVLLF